MKTNRLVIPLAMLLVLLLAPARLGAQTTAITYQGRLTDNGTPANGVFDFHFAAHNAASGGSPVGNAVDLPAVPVTNGLFTVALDFGPGVFTGAARWLELGVRTNGSADPHFILAPRQPITAAPYALQAANAATAATVSGSVPAASLTGTLDPARLPASVAVLTNASSQFTGALGAQQLSGGTNHLLAGMFGGIGAGRLNTNVADHAFIGGGYWNSIGLSSSNAVVGGGNFNRIEADSWQAGIFTGNGNTIRTNAPWSVIVGGGLNLIEAGATEAFIGAGRQHRLRGSVGAFIGAGNGNIIEPLSDYALIGAGSDNRIDTFSVGAVIAGGESQFISTNARDAVIGGGLGNRIETLGQQATIAGGVNNTVHSNGWGGAIGGGRANRVGTNAWFSVVPGGDGNAADGKYSFAAGRRAIAAHDGAFVWADSTDADFVSTGNNQLLLRASGGVGIGKNNPVSALDVNGTVSATAFAGDGSALAGLNAGALQSGTVDAARIPNLDAGKLTTGTLADARLSANVAKLNSANTFNTSQTIVSGSSAGKALVVRGTVAQSGNLQEWQAATTSPVASVSPSGVFTGSGAGLTSLNADNLGSGTVADARLSANVARLNSSPTFTGTVTAGAFAGSGSGLSGVPGALPWLVASGTAQTAAANTAYLLNNAALTTVTLPPAPAPGDVVRVNGVGVAGWQLQANTGQAIAGHAPTVNWTAVESSRAWQGIASSSDGAKLVAVVKTGQIYTSADSGATWTARESSREWEAVASSADGVKLVAVASKTDGVHTSTDSGVTWTARGNAREWRAVASSADGTKLVAVVNNGQIYTSTDSGATWTARQSNRQWSSVASSSDGTKLVAVVSSGQIYTSTDSGVTWTARESVRGWRSVASSADGVKLAAVVQGGRIYTSGDSGVTWAAQESIRNWVAAVSSADGVLLAAAVANGEIYTSADSGATWTPRETSRSWQAVAASADGSRLAAVVNGGQIHTGMLLPSTVVGAAGTTTALQYAGEGQWHKLTEASAASVAVENIAGGPVALLNADQTFAGAQTLTNAANLFVGQFIGDGNTLTNLRTSSFTTGTFDPARIPNLDAAKLTSGTLAEARLPAGVALLASSPAFTGDVSAARLQVGTAHGLGGLRSTIAGGQNNTNLADYAGVGGGFRNGVQAGASYSRIGGGQLNTIQNDAFYATLGGGFANTIEPFAEQATIAGGGQGSIGTNAIQATIGGGNANAIRAGSQGSTISGGTGNAIEAGALAGVIGGGSGNSIQAGVASATVGGGFQNTIQSGAAYAVIPGGRHALASLHGQAAHAAGRFAANGDAQTSTLVLRQQTTDASQQELFLDGPGGTSQRITIASGSTWVFDILVVARTTLGASAGYAIRGVIENSGGTTALVGSPAVTTLGEDTAAWEIAVEADNSLDALLIKATGEPATTIRWVATVRTVEVRQ